ncbi:hypothetical protein PRUPE_2G016900 [Prunus persica]|uniref:Histone deacetylase domain-containing protein n=1 Tax=Prunus persica TaxID=3760 RepID=A0A251Q9J7_PRUPE|nr:hypothetical protein PRUPE_2G016900 [Prunus persica]
MTELVVPAIQKFEPEMMVLVAGQDSSAYDPIGRQCLTMEGYEEIGRIVRSLADRHCSGRLLIVQEGGYHTQRLRHWLLKLLNPLKSSRKTMYHS